MKVASFEKLKSDWNQTWFIYIIWELSYVHAVKGHLRSSCKIGWKCENDRIWKVKSDFEPNSVIDIICEPSYVHAVKGYVSRSKVIWGQVCKITWKCKFGLICILEDQLELP